jgi:hypothetical protein
MCGRGGEQGHLRVLGDGVANAMGKDVVVYPIGAELLADLCQ